MIGRIRKSSSGLNIFDLFDDELYINKIIQLLKEKYEIKLSDFYENPIFEEFQDIIINNTRINISWDHMAGCSIMALDLNGDELIEEIANYLNTYY
ncbi:hypothetical protein OD350_12555 [Clostridium beijerinckii]|uniref:hypothetical protein n=1 Tax=Clostridium beijerinckii TaxID=1520 RepID=UPI00156DEB30|nr:hypothetical protein [Clostridium beijerinckii]NRT35832.1 hypothetical protein [Clostridium beijerinckii]NRT44742.1 hypothetical protein [Clostridium beijerinckii]NRZ21266.1 hypothetical protein [Clostridium beijerinckii]UYZ38460.1 hypothetical protein OD350_12555 [Clostridium beijerinckii]